MTAKLIIGTNTLPDLKDLDSAIRGRVRVLPFDVDIPAKLREQGLPLRSVAQVVEDLRDEFPGILQDLVAAVRERDAAGGKLWTPQKVDTATRTYLDAQDPLAEWIAACCVKDGARERRPFAEWRASFMVQSERDEKSVTGQWFGRELANHGFEKEVNYKGKYYTGPALTPEAAGLAKAWAESAAARRERYGR